MASAEVTALIAGVSAVAGGAIVAASNYLINRAEARDARRTELQRALVDLWDVVNRIDHQLRAEPQSGRATGAINRAMSSRAPQLYHALGLLRRRLLEPRLDDLAAAMFRALSTATVLAPPALLPALGGLTEAMERADQRDPDWWASWNAARNDYFLRCREIVGHPVPNAQSKGSSTIR